MIRADWHPAGPVDPTGPAPSTTLLSIPHAGGITDDQGPGWPSFVVTVTSEVEADDNAAAMQLANLMRLRQDALIFSIGGHRVHGSPVRLPIGKPCGGQKLPSIWTGINLAHSHFRPVLLVYWLHFSANSQDIFLFGRSAR